MTVPKSKVLSCTQGVMAIADAKCNYTAVKVPNNATQTQTVNVVVGENALPKNIPAERSLTSEAVEVKYGSESLRSNGPYPNTTIDETKPTVLDINPYSKVEDRGQSPFGLNTVEDLQKALIHQENVSKALAVMLRIIENNPLIVNKLIIADIESLRSLVKLLTDADEVEIVTLDPEVTCVCSFSLCSVIDKIFVYKDGVNHNLKYSFPDVIKILDDHNISYKMSVPSIVPA